MNRERQKEYFLNTEEKEVLTNAFEVEKENANKDFLTEKYAFPYQDLKTEINTFVWMFADPELTLGQADEISMKILDLLLNN